MVRVWQQVLLESSRGESGQVSAGAWVMSVAEEANSRRPGDLG